LNVSSTEVNVQLLFTDGFQQPAFTTEMVLNEVRKTVAHETGHGVHISHRPQNSGQQCPDSATLGSAVSVMNNGGPLNGQDGSYPGSQYNAVDIQQIRLHLRPNP
jgi:hypothetical protein